MRTGMANLPLHGHHCPRWLFDRMVRLSSAIVEVIVEEYGPEEILKRMSDPFWEHWAPGVTKEGSASGPAA